MKQSELIQEINMINNTLVTVTATQDFQDRLVKTYWIEGTYSALYDAKALIKASKTPFERVIGGFSIQLTTYKSYIGEKLV